ncbi:MAG TPA: hypothetical protein VJ951_16485, partial [Bacteroidales bacterium]|nr:hypothetical protein [Bacteroidales bacterium]
MMKLYYNLIRQYWLFAVILLFAFTNMRLDAQVTLYGPVTPPPKGASITFSGTENDGQIGFSGGKTYTFQAIPLASSTKVFWTIIE